MERTQTMLDAATEARVRDSFARQGFMRNLGAEIVQLDHGRCELRARFRPDLSQQHGFFHAGVTTTLCDSAAGYAAFSTMPDGSTVLTTELKLNLLAPARGEELRARAEVVKTGRTLVVVRADAYGVSSGAQTHVATMLATMMCLQGKSDGA